MCVMTNDALNREARNVSFKDSNFSIQTNPMLLLVECDLMKFVAKSVSNENIFC